MKYRYPINDSNPKNQYGSMKEDLALYGKDSCFRG